MGHKFNPERMSILLAPERRSLLDPAHVLELLPIAEDQTVADVGCGPGYFSIPLGHHLTTGRLYAFDVQEEMVRAAAKNVKEAGLTNVEVQLSSEHSIPTATSSLDGVFFAFALHEVEGPLPTFVAMLRDRLRPGGWLAVLDWKKEEMEECPPLHERLTEDEVRDIGEASGMTFTSAIPLNPKQYLVLFGRPVG